VAIPVREESEVEEFVPVSTPIPLRADPAMLAEVCLACPYNFPICADIHQG